MAKKLITIVSKTPPKQTNVLWLDSSGDTVVPKIFQDGWEIVEKDINDNINTLQGSVSILQDKVTDLENNRILDNTPTPVVVSLNTDLSDIGYPYEGVLGEEGRKSFSRINVSADTSHSGYFTEVPKRAYLLEERYQGHGNQRRQSRLYSSINCLNPIIASDGGTWDNDIAVGYTDLVLREWSGSLISTRYDGIPKCPILKIDITNISDFSGASNLAQVLGIAEYDTISDPITLIEASNDDADDNTWQLNAIKYLLLKENSIEVRLITPYSERPFIGYVNTGSITENVIDGVTYVHFKVDFCLEKTMYTWYLEYRHNDDLSYKLSIAA